MKNQSLIPFLFFLLLIACQNTTTISKTPSKETTEAETINTPVQAPKAAIAKANAIVPNDYRNKNWRPAEGNYYFSETWTWNYHNEMLPPTDPHHKGTFSVYIDPPTGTMLLADHLDEMTDWIIIHPDGNYTTAFTDVHGKPHIVEQKMADFPEHDFYLSLQAADFKKYFTQQTGSKTFGTNKYGWQTIQATPFEMTFEKTNDIAQLHLLEMPFSVRGLYLAAQTNQDLNFPINFNYGYLLPEKYLVVSEAYQQGGKKVGFELASISPGEYFVNTVTYPLDH